MLVIRRRAGQSLLIGESIEIEIIEVTSTTVKLGIRAPKEIALLRKEIKMTQEENRIAAKRLSSKAIQNLIEKFRRSLAPAASKKPTDGKILPDSPYATDPPGAHRSSQPPTSRTP